MTPQQAGAMLNTADLAYRAAKDGAATARRYGLEIGPWRQAMADARKTRSLAEKWLVRT